MARLWRRDLYKGLKVVFFVTEDYDIFVQVIKSEGVGGDAKDMFYCSIAFVATKGLCTYMSQK